MTGELKKIKKLYGENFAKLCRESFPVLIAQAKLLQLLLKHFYPSRELYNDLVSQDAIESFKDYVYKLSEKKEEDIVEEVQETPEELMKKAGYTLYKCETFDDILKFKKYYEPDEELCSFKKDKDRIKTHIVFFAVKDNVDEIHREDFENPQRQDEYGTSVISIQFAKSNSNLSIKNRYNHTVPNCDATFMNNLDTIYPRLTESFNKYYNLKSKIQKVHDFELNNYVITSDGEYIKYNYEMDNNYYCPNNIVVNKNGEKYCYDKSRYELIDYYLLDKSEKTLIYLPEENETYGSTNDSFLKDFVDIKKIDVLKENDNKKIIVTKNNDEEFWVEIDKNNRIIGYHNNNRRVIENAFMIYGKYLKHIHIPNVKKIGNSFCACNEKLEVLDCSSVEKIGDDFCSYNENLEVLDCPSLIELGNRCLRFNNKLSKVNLPNLLKVGIFCFQDNKEIETLNLPSVKEIGDEFLYTNEKLKNLNAPNVEKIGEGFLSYNKQLARFDALNLLEVDDNFLYRNNSLKVFNAPKLITTGHNFLYHNDSLEGFNAPNLCRIKRGFLQKNTTLKECNIPFDNIKIFGDTLRDHPERNVILGDRDNSKIVQQKRNILERVIAKLTGRDRDCM